MTGTAQVGQVLRVTNGRWRSDRPLVFAYQWQLCEPATRTCSVVAGATDRIYAVRPGDAGEAVVAIVSATNADGATASSSSRPTLAVTAQEQGAPSAETIPTIVGDLEIGSTLTAKVGKWAGDEPIELSYRWRRCTALGGACAELAQTESTYVLTARDRGRTLRVLVRGENERGTAWALADATQLIGGVKPLPPQSTAPPVVTGKAAQDETLTASTGSWSGTTPMRFAFEWRRCDERGDDCASIARTTRASYVLSARDVGHTLRVRVTARNAAGSSRASSAPTAIVAGTSAPVNTVAPSISGTARAGSVLTASSGSWRGDQPITFGYRWLRCNSRGDRCAAMRSATERTHALTSSDVGRTLRVRVTATNERGSASALSRPSGVVAPSGIAPSSAAPPTVSGDARQGQRLSASAGTWRGTQPISFSYTWQRCDGGGGDCAPISGAGGTTYVLGRADVGHRLRVVVVARNSVGTSNATSNVTAVVVGVPLNTELPKVSGEPVEGKILVASTGSWTGVGPITFGYQWTRCNERAEFSSCTPIVVTSQPSYVLRAADIGHRIFVQVKANNGYGATYVNSDPTGVVSPAPIGTVTVHASRGVVVFGGGVTLFGRVVGAPSGERVTIVQRGMRGIVRVHANAALIGPGGTWSYRVQPSLGTTYEVRFRGKTSGRLLVQVRPSVVLRKARAGRVTIRIIAGRPLPGKVAFLQRWNARKHRWATIRRVRLRATARNHVKLATVRLSQPRRTFVRAVFPGQQGGRGYLTGTSNRIRTG